MSESRHNGPGVRTKPLDIRDRAMAAADVTSDAAKLGAEKARFAQRRTEVPPDESKPEGDAVNAVEDTEQQLANDARRAGQAMLRHAASRRNREAATMEAGNDSGIMEKNEAAEIQTGEKSPSRARQNRALLKKKEALASKDVQPSAETGIGNTDAAPVTAPRSRLLSPEEMDDNFNSSQEASSEAIPLKDEAAEVPTGEEPPRRARQNRALLKKKGVLASKDIQPSAETGIGNSDAASVTAPRTRLLSPEEMERARARSFGSVNPPEAISQPPIESAAAVISGTDALPAPRIHHPQSEICHERPALQAPVQREVLHDPVASVRVVESQLRVEIRTSDVSIRAADKTVSAAAEAAKQKVEQEASNRAARHMKALSKQASERMAKALKESSRAAMRAVEAAAQALISALTTGSGAVVAVILVVLMCASLLASPFGIFTHADGIEDPGSYTLSKAIAEINEEYAKEVEKKASGHDNVSIVIEGNIEEDVEPVNWVDVLGVFAVHVTMRDEDAMNIVDLGEEQLKELRTVFWDMNTLTVETETDEDGETSTCVVGHALSYKDMVEKYHFTDQQKQLLEEIMSDEYYAFWSNFISDSTGHGSGDWTGVTSVDDDDDDPSGDPSGDPGDPGYKPSFSGGAMKIPKIYQYNYKKTVCVINGQSKSASTSGCGATSMCMVIHYLTGNTSPTPYTLMKWAYDHGKYHGDGLDHGAVSAMGKLYDVTGSWVGKDGQKIVNALNSGHPVIAHMGPGIFTKAGHYIVLRGVTKDGKILVNDPGSSSRTGKAYPLSIILKQGKNSKPFMICSK